MKQQFDFKAYFTFLSRNRAYTAINVFGLSVSLMFVLLIGVYIWQERAVDRHYRDADRIEALGVQFEGETATEGIHHIVQTYLRQRYPEIENSCGLCFDRVRVHHGTEFLKCDLMLADSTFFDMFETPFVEGDPATCLDDRGGIVLSESLARQLFGGRKALGQTVVCRDTLRFRVTAVVADFDNSIFKRPDAIVNFYNERYGNYANTDEGFRHGSINFTGSSVFLLLREGHTFKGREKELTAFFHSFWDSFNNKEWPCQASITPLSRLYLSRVPSTQGNTRRGDAVLVNILGAVALVILLFAVINYINLTVALSSRRAREMATRRLFGAQRGTVRVRLMLESVVLCLLSFILSCGMTAALAPAFGTMLGTKIDLQVLLRPLTVFALVAGIVLIGLLSGAIPAVIISRAKPVEVVRGTFARITKMRLSKVFIILQNVITITMLACACIMLHQTRHLVHAPMGFTTDRLLSISPDGSSDSATMAAFAQQVSRLPFVRNMTFAMGTPVDGGNNNTFFFGGKGISFQIFCADEQFFDIFGLRLKNGGKAEAGKFYLNAQALRDIRMSPHSKTPRTFFTDFEFYGVPNTAQYGGEFADFHIRNIENEAHPMIIYISRMPKYVWTITLRMEGDLVEGYNEVARVYRRVFRSAMTERDASYVDQQVQEAFADQLRTSHIVSMFAFMAILISMLGLVAMSTYFIQQRRREIAIRKVFGSTVNQVRSRLIRSFLSYVGIAFVIAAPVVYHFMADWISQFGYRILWWPWIPAAGVLVLLFSFGAVAVQSWVASNENPVRNIRQE